MTRRNPPTRETPHHIARRNPTRAVRIGGVVIGDGHPIALQSMCATPTTDVDATLAQTLALARAGADIVRVAADNRRDADALVELRERLRESLADDGDHGGDSTVALSVDLQEN
ncbi:MAG: flavodoxin-dependent (E)-4-hydroxy-3-methylbut-2-enyl-diphosphate synthase, partial [bacterium]